MDHKLKCKKNTTMKLLGNNKRENLWNLEVMQRVLRLNTKNTVINGKIYILNFKIKNCAPQKTLLRKYIKKLQIGRKSI